MPAKGLATPTTTEAFDLMCRFLRLENVVIQMLDSLVHTTLLSVEALINEKTNFRLNSVLEKSPDIRPEELCLDNQ